MMRYLFIILLGWYGTSVHAQPADTTLLRIAGEHLKAKRCKDVDKVLSPLLRQDPPATDAVLISAKCRIWHQGEVKEGLQQLDLALQREPDHYGILHFRGDLYNDLRMFDRAEEDLIKAVSLALDTASLISSLDRRSWNYFNMRHFDKARSDGERVLLMDSTDRGALNSLAMVAKETGDTATAHKMLKAYLRHHPEDRVATLNLGLFMGTLGRHSEALELYAAAEKLGDPGANFYNNRGYSKLGVGDVKGARQDVERSIRMNRSNPYAYRNMALIELQEKRIDAACSSLEKALQFGFTKIHGNEVLELRRTHCH